MTRTRPAAGYDPADFVPFVVAVDLVALTVRLDALQVLLVNRTQEPFAGRLALPGGFLKPEETLDTAATRELVDETGLHGPPKHLEQLGTYWSPDRDPRLRVMSVAYLALAPRLPLPRPGGDPSAAAWVPVDEARDSGLAFDHGAILTDGIERARAKLEYTSLATAFCPAEFSMSDLRHIYEVVWGTKLDPRNFHRKVTSTPKFVMETGHTSITDGPGRPPGLYRSGPIMKLNPPLTREPDL